ncbi:MAG TPA: hypothetical protein VEX63_13260 [Flavisolibacter sp.]|nr:hypothetical protein [Flavisolibacter sp.]
MNAAKIIRIIALLINMVAATDTQAQRNMLNGVIKDSITHLPIHGVTVSNPITRTKVTTDAKGFFRIAVAPDEILYFFAPTYRIDTLRYSVLFQNPIELFLTPNGVWLGGVTVEAQYSKYQLDSMERIASFKTAQGQRLQTASALNEGGFGIGINLDRVFKSKYKQHKKQEALFKRTEERAYIDSRFSAKMVSAYTGLKGERLWQFMLQYTPEYAWLRRHTSQEEVLVYINEKLKIFNRQSP